MKALSALLGMPWFGLKAIGVVVHWVFLFLGYSMFLGLLGEYLLTPLMYRIGWHQFDIWWAFAAGLTAIFGATWDTYGLVTYKKRQSLVDSINKRS